MKYSTKTLIRIVLLSIALFVLVQFVFARPFEFFEPKVDGILFQVIETDKK